MAYKKDDKMHRIDRHREIDYHFHRTRDEEMPCRISAMGRNKMTSSPNRRCMRSRNPHPRRIRDLKTCSKNQIGQGCASPIFWKKANNVVIFWKKVMSKK